MTYRIPLYSLFTLILTRTITFSEPLNQNRFEWLKGITIFTDVFIKNYNKDSEIGYTLVVNVELDVEYRYYLQPLHADIPFLPEKSCKLCFRINVHLWK